MSSSNSGGGKTRTRTVTHVPSTKGHSKYEKEVVKVARAASIVEIGARGAYDGPDTFVLRSTDGEVASDCTYWKELSVQDQEQSGDLIECAFTLAGQQGTARTKKELRDRRYTLIWRPTGGEENEIILFENCPYEEAWNAGEERSVAATMTTARFRECSALQLPSEDGELDVDLPGSLNTEYEPLSTDTSHMFPRPKAESGRPVKSRSDSNSSGDETNQGTASVPGARPPETEPPHGDRWVAVYGVFATDEEDYDPEFTLLGVYKVTESGEYKHADVSETEPSPSGPAQADVLLPAGHVATGRVNLFARLALGTPSSERFKQGEELLRRGGGDQEDLLYATTPVFFGEPATGEAPTPEETGPHPLDPSVPLRLQEPAAHASASEEGLGLDVYLINPIWAAERRVRAAEAAQDHYQEWIETVGAADGHAGLLSELCYNPVHGRGYLADHLASALDVEVDPGARGGEIGAEVNTTVKDTYDMRGAWAPFKPGQVFAHEDGNGSMKGEGDQLGQFAYGLRCKRAFLMWNRRRACRRASRLLAAPHVYQALLDLCSSPEPTALGTRAVEWGARLTLSGGEGPFSDDAPAALVEAATRTEMTLEELTGADLAAVLLKVGERVAAYKLALAMGPAVAADWTSEGVGPPTGLSELAHFYMRITHGPDGYTNAAGAAGEIELVPEGSEQAEVSIVKERRGQKGDPAVRYKMRVSGEVKQEMEASMEKLETKKIGGATAGLRLLTGIASIIGLANAVQNDQFGVGEALSLCTLGLEIAALYNESPSYSTMMRGKVPAWVGPTLKLLGPVADVTLGTWELGRAATNTTPRGQAEVDNPNVWGIAGAVLSTAGGIALTVGSGGTVVALGAVGLAAGGGASLYGGLSEMCQVEAADPLSDWLPTEDLWGREYGADREPLFDAVRPDPSVKADLSSKQLGGKPLPRAMADQTKAAAEQGFYFPTRVGVRKPEEASPVGLQLEIAVGYLPSYGTLMVNSKVIPAAPNLRERALQCAVHYVKTDGGFRYCVVRKGERLELPGKGGSALPEWSKQENWSWAAPEEIRMPDGEAVEAPMLGVHVGEWPTDYNDRERRQTGKYARRMHVEKQLWVEANVFDPLGITGKNEAEGLMQNRREAERVKKTADPAAHWSGPDGLVSILESGEFEVSGSVYFSPLRPFQSNAEIPESLEQARKQCMSFERLRFNYARDVK